jgi:nicotinate-nucleotide adenylyltransferase
MMPQRVGLMGGSFDPVHVAHVQLAHTALAVLELDQVRWLPAGQPWQKMAPATRQMTHAVSRLAMVRLATAHEPRFVVDTLELDRSGPTYTLDTLEALQQAHPQVVEWYLVIGQDQYARFHTWHGWQHILQMVTLAVACRGDALPATPAPLQQVPHRWQALPMPPSQVSSTDIRARLAAGRSAISLVPDCLDEAVARYIAHHQLYALSDPH